MMLRNVYPFHSYLNHQLETIDESVSSKDKYRIIKFFMLKPMKISLKSITESQLLSQILKYIIDNNMDYLIFVFDYIFNEIQSNEISKCLQLANITKFELSSNTNYTLNIDNNIFNSKSKYTIFFEVAFIEFQSCYRYIETTLNDLITKLNIKVAITIDFKGILANEDSFNEIYQKLDMLSKFKPKIKYYTFKNIKSPHFYYILPKICSDKISITVINIEHCDQFVKREFNFTNLESVSKLIFDGNQLSLEFFNVLDKMNCLKLLSLNNCPNANYYIDEFLNYMKIHWKHIEGLGISNWNIKLFEFIKIINFIEENMKVIQKLSIGNKVMNARIEDRIIKLIRNHEIRIFDGYSDYYNPDTYLEFIKKVKKQQIPIIFKFPIDIIQYFQNLLNSATNEKIWPIMYVFNYIHYIECGSFHISSIHSNLISQDIYFTEPYNSGVNIDIDSIKADEIYPGFTVLYRFKKGVFLCRDNDVFPPHYCVLKYCDQKDLQSRDFENKLLKCKFCCESQINKIYGNSYFTIMDYIPGFHLRDCIDNEYLPKDPVRRCLVDFKIICSFASQMITLLENNVYHPDISFNNLIIDSDFYGHLIDFQNIGVFTYTSCSYVPNHHPDRAKMSKKFLMMYSFGAILFLLLSGKYIFGDAENWENSKILIDDSYQNEENLKNLLPYQQKLFTEFIYPICFNWDKEGTRNPQIIKETIYKIVNEFDFKENFESIEYDDSFIYELNEILYFCFEESKMMDSPRFPEFWGNIHELEKFYNHYKDNIDNKDLINVLKIELNLWNEPMKSLVCFNK